ncbi:Uncharacterised protein [Vibrio cholerae]|nr:Uncharacterised protein [Vibrio cholerae]
MTRSGSNSGRFFSANLRDKACCSPLSIALRSSYWAIWRSILTIASSVKRAAR